jgi:DNA-binding response OmpR family regulator
MARIRALLRRGSPSVPPDIEWGKLRLNPNTYEATYGDRPLPLTPKEYRLLKLLLRHGCRLLSPGMVLESLWSFEAPPGEDAVKTHVKCLRQKLKTAGAANDFIETVYGLG